MDEELTLRELGRLENERKLRSIPGHVLETTWVREAQIEAVIDAVLAATFSGSPESLVHARHVGEWCARIAAGIEFGPDPSFARRVGVLADIDPGVLEMLPELECFTASVRAYQQVSVTGYNIPSATTLIVHVADEFARRLNRYEHHNGPSPSAVMIGMLTESNEGTRVSVEALQAVLHLRHIRVA